jgi:UDP-2-acetamido-2,6-beta-L-arabino-hexul-4-ose reductase
MNVLITGANGFVGKNFQVFCNEKGIDFDTFTRENSIDELDAKIQKTDFIVHLAGINRPENIEDFKKGNTDLTSSICNLLIKYKNLAPVIYTSSIQADLNNPYGKSKLGAETALKQLQKKQGNQIFNYRLPNVFGKWCKPNYNSAVATFCHNIANNIPVQVNDPSSMIRLVYIDDVISDFCSKIENHRANKSASPAEIKPIYQITVGELQDQLLAFKESKSNHIIENVGNGLIRALYSTYISYFKPEQFSYSLVKHEDPRGVFVEMLKTKDSGQFSFFSAHPGITRGGHYHHSKNEKFLVVKGSAKFGFRNIVTDEYSELLTSGDEPQVVETVPGWSHDITNIGDDEMFVMLWANEIFDPENPDTIYHKV